MQIYARSLVPTTPLPYMHLGYLAASTFEPRLYGCLYGVLVGVVGLKLFSMYWRTSRRKALSWMIIMSLVGMALAINGHRIAQDELTGYRTHELALHICTTLRRGEQIPEDIHAIPKALQLKDSMIRDNWSREMRLTVRKVPRGNEYRVESAGRDGKFGTRDDYYTRLVPRDSGYSLWRWRRVSEDRD